MTPEEIEELAELHARRHLGPYIQRIDFPDLSAEDRGPFMRAWNRALNRDRSYRGRELWSVLLSDAQYWCLTRGDRNWFTEQWAVAK